MSRRPASYPQGKCRTSKPVDDVSQSPTPAHDGGMKSLTLTGIAQAVRWHRGAVALLALFIAVATGLSALMPNQAEGVPVVAAAHELPPGAVIAADDLTVITLDQDLVPDGASATRDDLVGRALSIGVTRGTPITSAVVTADALTDHALDEVLVPFRVRDPDVAGLLRLGDRITVVTSSPEGVVTTVAEHVRVAQLPSQAASGLLSSGTASGALIVIAAPRDVAHQLAGVSDQWLGVIID